MPIRWTRHHCHLITYGLVSLSLMCMGLIFSVFAIFVKDNELSKVWLAGPTTMAVGLVLCGKVIIDCRPTLEGQDMEDDDLCDEESVLGDSPKKVVVHKQDVITSIDAQYEKKRQEVSLFIPNLGIKNKDKILLSDRIPMTPQTDTESDIWNPRTSMETLNDEEELESDRASTSAGSKKSLQECLCTVIANDQTEYALIHQDNSSSNFARNCLNSVNNTPSVSVVQEEQRRKFVHSKELQFPKKEAKPFVEKHLSPLYQGETFVLYEKQYLI